MQYTFKSVSSIHLIHGIIPIIWILPKSKTLWVLTCDHKWKVPYLTSHEGMHSQNSGALRNCVR